MGDLGPTEDGATGEQIFLKLQGIYVIHCVVRAGKVSSICVYMYTAQNM